MKKMIGFATMLGIFLATGSMTWAQIVMPDLSPFATVTQKVGYNEVRIEYSRPSVRGRVVFGDLVPYNEVWRAGANASTKLYFRETVTIQDTHKVPPGIYALYAIPGKEEWTIIISRDPWLWGAFGYKEDYDEVRFPVKAEKLRDQVETFTIQFANVGTSNAAIEMLWDFTKVSFRISTSLDEKVMSDIKTFTSNPEARVAGEYYLSAKYYLDTNRDPKQALEWVDKALSYAPGSYWMTHTKAEILAKMGNFKEAIETANLSIEQAKSKDDADYVRMNELEIAKWKQVRKDNRGSSN